MILTPAFRLKLTRYFANFSLALAMAALLGAPLANAAPHNDFEDVSWIDGEQRLIYGTVFTEPARPDGVDVYVIGPVNADAPLDDLTLDPHYPYIHDHVTSKTPFGQRTQAHFLVVQVGPNGNSGNVHTRTVVQNPDAGVIEPDDGSFHITPTREAPYEINLGQGFVPLVSVDVVKAGIAAGLLQVVEIAKDLPVTGWSGGVASGE